MNQSEPSLILNDREGEQGKNKGKPQRGRAATKRFLKPLIDTDFHGYLKIVFEKQIEERHRVVQRICIKCSNK